MKPPLSENKLVARIGEVAHPIKVSENSRYFVDQRGDSVFWLGTTRWNLFHGYNLEEATTILEKKFRQYTEPEQTNERSSTSLKRLRCGG